VGILTETLRRATADRGKKAFIAVGARRAAATPPRLI
jgi:hypothetical protein